MHTLGAPFALEIRAHPRIVGLRQHVVPPQPPNYSQLGFRAHPPNPPQGGFLALCLPSPELRWITVGLWAFFCAGRSTRSKASQQQCPPRPRPARSQPSICPAPDPQGSGGPRPSGVSPRPPQATPKRGLSVPMVLGLGSFFTAQQQKGQWFTIRGDYLNLAMLKVVWIRLELN